ncbi:MAG TPA: ABC transporter substrate-binding protein, partial [Spirochaetota bacterium]|nr:ABC transporter substrate-binding protein [Spirochaetota bacterium]
KLYDSGAWIPLDTLPFFRSFYWRWLQFPDVPGFKDTTEIFESPFSGGYFWIDEDIKKETLDALQSGKTFKPEVKVIDKYR